MTNSFKNYNWTAAMDLTNKTKLVTKIHKKNLYDTECFFFKIIYVKNKICGNCCVCFHTIYFNAEINKTQNKQNCFFFII